MFYVLMASVEWSFGNIFGYVLAGSLIACACYNAYVIWKYPKYREVRDKLAKEEDERIQRKIQENVRKEAAKAVFKG